jgi:tight adherence protein B
MAAASVFLLAGGAAFFLSFAASDALRKAFEEYQRKYLARSVRDLSAMFLFIEPRQVLRLNLCALILLAAAGYWLSGALCAAVAAVAGFFAPALLVRLLQRRRIARFNAQLAEALQQMANALRAGFTLQQAADQVGRDADAPLRQELGLFI